jgi:hypothetical protein
MEPVNNLAHFDTLLKEFRSDGKRIITNCYLMPDEITRLTRRGFLTFRRGNNHLILFHEKADIYRLYFYFNRRPDELRGVKLPKITKPITLELVYYETSKPDHLEDIENFWVENGFNFFTAFYQTAMSNPLKETDPDIPIKIDPGSYHITLANPTQAREIADVWKSNLGIIVAANPFEDELAMQISEGQVYIVMDQDNAVAATQQITRSGKVGTLFHGACVEKHRRNGLLRALIHTCLNKNKDLTRWVSWVEENNHPARMMHKNIGLEINGKISRQLIYNK